MQILHCTSQYFSEQETLQGERDRAGSYRLVLLVIQEEVASGARITSASSLCCGEKCLSLFLCSVSELNGQVLLSLSVSMVADRCLRLLLRRVRFTIRNQ